MFVEYGYVIAVVAFAAAANMWMAVVVGRNRSKIGLKYPKVFADGDSEEGVLFNCKQRAHQNNVEQSPFAMLVVAALGTQKPITAAILGLTYTVGRIVYFKGYSTGKPEQRVPGTKVAFLSLAALLLVAFYTGLETALGW